VGGVQIVVVGNNARLRAIGKKLKALDDKSLQRELGRGIGRAAKPAMQAVRDSTGQYVPNRFAPVLAKSLQMRTSNVAAGLRITATGKGQAQPRRVAAMNAGQLRHPLFGRRAHWYTQAVTPGFFDKPIEEKAPAFREELERVLDEVAAKITS
jgi:hypothetical protein